MSTCHCHVFLHDNLNRHLYHSNYHGTLATVHNLIEISSECTFRMCWFRSQFRKKVFRQWSHEKTISLVWQQLMWAFRLFLRVNSLEQCSQVKINSLVWMLFTCWLRWDFWVKLSRHWSWSQVKIFTLVCKSLVCLFRLDKSQKIFGQ